MKKPTDATYAAAIARLKNGFGLRETIRYFEHHFGVNIPPATLHRKWEKAKNETPEQQAGTMEQQTGTAKAGVLPDVLPTVTATAQNAVLSVENAVSPRSEQDKSRSTMAETMAFFVRNFSLMHVVFYTTTGTACYAIWDTLPNVVGGALLTIFGLFSIDSVLKAQNGEDPIVAEYGRNRVVVSELVASVFHWLILNKYLWEIKNTLPFKIIFTTKAGDWRIMDGNYCTNCYWEGGEAIAYAAFGVAALVFAAAFAAVDSILRVNKK